MRSRLLCAVLLLIGTILFFGTRAPGQTPAVDESLSALQSELKADKDEVIRRAMRLKGAESDAFWRVYKLYDRGLLALNDELGRIVKSYNSKYVSLGYDDAKLLSSEFLQIQIKRLQLKKKYLPIFGKATTPLVAARFFQLDYRLELLQALRLSSEVPVLLPESDFNDAVVPGKQ